MTTKPAKTSFDDSAARELSPIHSDLVERLTRQCDSLNTQPTYAAGKK